MTKIHNASIANTEISSRLGDVRAALAARVEPSAVDDDVAPMMGELLPRLEDLLGDARASTAPAAPDGRYGPADRVRLLARAQPRIEQLASESGGGPLAAASEIVRSHVALATEVAMRSGV